MRRTLAPYMNRQDVLRLVATRPIQSAVALLPNTGAKASGLAKFGSRGPDSTWAGRGGRWMVIRQESDMAAQTASPLLVGQVFEITFPTFTPRITVHSERGLTVEIIAGDNVGFSDTVEYEAVTVRDGLVLLSWREHIGSTIVHVLDLISPTAYTAITPAKGGFMRLTGRIEVKSSS